MVHLDPANEFQARAIARLRNESTAWLTTIGAEGTPQPNPIWFLWNGADKVLIYSVEAAKPRHIGAHPRVSFSFNTNEGGDDVVIFTGSAVVDREQPLAANNEAYLEKYAGSMSPIGYTIETFSEKYSAPIVVTLENVRGF